LGNVLLYAGRHIDLVDTDAVGGISEAGLQLFGVFLSLGETLGIGQVPALRLDHRELVVAVGRFNNLSRDAVARAILRHCDEHDIPRPSAIASSGRGNHLKWCYDAPIGREHVGRMVALNRTLAKRLAPLGADPKATDATRLLRVTGSVHSGAHRMVEVLHLEQRDGHTITYDPHALAEKLVPLTMRAPEVGVMLPHPDLAPRIERDSHNKPLPWFKEGQVGWYWAIIHDCERLIQLRGWRRIPEQWRDRFPFVIACQVARMVPPDEALPEIMAFGERLAENADGFLSKLPGYCGTALRKARDAWGTRNWSHLYWLPKLTMIEWLEIERHEMPHMRALIDETEYLARHAKRERMRRIAAGRGRACGLCRRGERGCGRAGNGGAGAAQ
jgi:hypothetical protein